jgi:hypothetical protein
VAARISAVERIVVTIRIPVQPLRVRRRGNNRVGLNEPPDLGVVVAGVVVVQPGFLVENLAGVAVRDVKRECVIRETRLTERSVFVVLDEVTVAVKKI